MGTIMNPGGPVAHVVAPGIQPFTVLGWLSAFLKPHDQVRHFGCGDKQNALAWLQGRE
jgi:hypothetical protein